MTEYTSRKKIQVNPENSGIRLDLFLSKVFPDISRTKLQQVIEDGEVFLNAKKAKKRDIVQIGNIVEIDEKKLILSEKSELIPQNIDLDILYEDEHFIAVNKAAGMIVHPGNGNRDNTLVNALLFHFSSLSAGSEPDRPGIVHRLDKNTSGVLMVAKSDSAHMALAYLFAQRTIQKTYVGICVGTYPKQHDRIEGPIGRRRNDPLRFFVRDKGKEAVTEYELITHKDGVSVVRFFPRTGRTHQIRVHSSYAGFPIVADTLYGGSKKSVLKLEPLARPFAYKVFACFDRHALHARMISFVHPFSKKEITITAPFPQDFVEAMKLFEKSEELGNKN